MGLKSIQEYNITVGRRILIRRKNEIDEISDISSKNFYDYGFSSDGSLKKYFIDHEYCGKHVAVFTFDQAKDF